MANTPADIDIAQAQRWVRGGSPVIIITLTSVSGSAPRAAGTSMLVSLDETSGTVGGGALEWALISTARDMLTAGDVRKELEQPLGPEIGQCCGGRIRATLQRLTAATLDALQAPVSRPTVCIFGAGHVGGALARALSALPLTIEIVDQRADLLAPLAECGRVFETALPEAHIAGVPPGSAFVVTTHSHALDFMIVEAALRRGDAAYVGMIGSATKRAVLARHLATAGVPSDGLTCPIGAQRSSDKRPEIIAATTAAEIVGVLF